MFDCREYFFDLIVCFFLVVYHLLFLFIFLGRVEVKREKEGRGEEGNVCMRGRVPEQQ